MAEKEFQSNAFLIDCAVKVLREADSCKKAEMTLECLEMWKNDHIILGTDENHRVKNGAGPPDTPGRNPLVKLVSPSQLPKRGKGGSLISRQALLHSLVHIECCAIDLAWDIIARFGRHPEYQRFLPREFFDDFVVVAADEARHFKELYKRLQETGMEYGDLAAHDGLWESAMETKDSLPARLAIEHCTHEARGLDILPQTIQRFRNGGDEESAKLLENVIYPEEITHCAAGVKWLKHLHSAALKHRDEDKSKDEKVPLWITEAVQYETVEKWFHALVRKHFHGLLKPPFNDEARKKAGFAPAWYLPLSVANCTD